MRFKRFIYGKLWGLFQMIFWAFMSVWIIIILPLGYYYSNPSHVAPSYLQKVYDIKFFDWKITAMIIVGFLVIVVGFLLIWVGWYEMHPIKIKKIENNGKIDASKRLVAIKNFSKEKFLEKLRKNARYYYK